MKYLHRVNLPRLQNNEIRAFGEYDTRRLVLSAWNDRNGAS
jgi:hypothetical protein